jgi:DNA repair exonuclease SbcCD ATPase subunit
MKIVRLTAENIKRLHAVEITPDGSMIVIGGQNAQGKTSVLDAIAMALGGGDAACGEPLRHGAIKGKAVVELDDLIITRTFTKNGTALTVEGRDHSKYPSPQSVLDALVGKLTFDPLAFARMKSREQMEMLRQMTGLNFTLLDSRRGTLFDQRTSVNREVKQAEARLAGMKLAPGVPEEEVSVAELTKQIEIANATNTANAEQRAELRQLRNYSDQMNSERSSSEADMARLQKQLQEAAARVEKIDKDLDNLRMDYTIKNEVVRTLSDVDTSPILAQIETAEATNRQVRANKAYREARGTLDAKQREAMTLTSELEGIDEKKRLKLQATKFPVEGLSLSDDMVVFNGVPFDQASGAEQLRVSVAIGMAANPKLRVLLCRDGSLLDKKSLALLTEIVQEHGYQCWLERVSEGAECSVIIEDGQVKEVA